MWITVPEHLQEIKHPDMNESVDVSGGTTVQVTADVGELLVTKYDNIEEHETD